MTDKEQIEIFAKNLNRYISRSGKDQKEVALEIGFEPTTFNTWCKGKIMPSAPKVRKIADYFHIGVSFLLDEEPDPRTKELYLSDDDRYVLLCYHILSEDAKEIVDDIFKKAYEKNKAKNNEGAASA